MNTLRNHFIKSSTGGQPNYTISYTADLQVPFIGGKQKRGLTMWETGDESEPLATFEIVKDSFVDGYGAWDIKTSNPSCFYGLIKDKNGYEYSMDSDNFHTITGLIFPDQDYDYNYITEIGGPLLGGGEGNNLTDITLPYYLEYIGDSTFKGSTLLQTINIPEYVTHLGNYAFENCNSLTSIVIPYNVESIGKNCFKGCVNLTKFDCDSLTPPSLNGYNIFGNVSMFPNLKIYVGFVEDYLLNDDWSQYANIIYLNPCIISYKATTRPTLNLSNVTPSSYKYSAYKNGRGFIMFSNEVTQIKGQLFSSYTDAISNIYLPNTITSIGNSAFANCKGLTSITIPNSVTSIGKSAFYRCYSLTSMVIPDGVTSIGNGAFYECSSLTSINIPDGVTSIELTTFYYCTSLTAITIPNSVKSIASWSFTGCSSLTSITIPDSVTSIKDAAFGACYSITSVTWNARNCADFSPSSSAPFDHIKSQITSFTFGDSVQYIPSYLCYGMNNLTSITIPNSVTSIGDYAFRSCSSLTSITFQGAIAQWKKIELGEDWNEEIPATVVHCTDGDITL